MNTLLVAATHRSGSYLLCDLLSQIGDLPYPEEHFNFKLKTVREKLQLSGAVPNHEVFKSFLDSRESDQKMFTVKAMWSVFSDECLNYEEDNTLGSTSSPTQIYNRLGNLSILFIRRRDKIRQAVSFEIAKQTGVWRKRKVEEFSKTEVLYSYPRILACLEQIKDDEASWLKFFKDRKLPYHEIWYEDLVVDPTKEINKALGFVDIEPKYKVSPKTHFAKLSDGINFKWAEKFQDRSGKETDIGVIANFAKLLRDLEIGSIFARPSKFSGSIQCHTTKIEIKPYATKLITVKLKNDGQFSWKPKVNAHGLGDYVLELKDSRNKKSKPLWQTDLERVIHPGESTELSLLLKSEFSLEPFMCNLIFNYPGGKLTASNVLNVDIQLDEKWKALKRIFPLIAPSERSDLSPDWIHIENFGDISIKKFPFIFMYQHGWFFVHKESSSSGTLCVIDSELNYCAVHLNKPKEFHVFAKGSSSAKPLEFLGVEMGVRRFKDIEKNLVRNIPLSKWDA